MKKSKSLLWLIALCMVFLIISGCKQAAEPAAEQPVVVENADPVATAEPEPEPTAQIEGAGVELHFMGRASVRLDFADGRVIYIDPGYGVHKDSYTKEADILLVTHQHSDHNYTDMVKMKEDGVAYECPMDIESGDIVTVGDITIEAVDAYNSNHNKRYCCGFIITYNDLVIYHSGDTSTTTQMEEFPKYEIDYALLCMDGYYNMGVEEAKEVSDLIDAEAIIPIHTSKSGSFSLSEAMKFDHPSRIIMDKGDSLTLYDLSANDGVHMPLDEAIIDIMADRQKAIEDEDYDLFMSSIGINNQFFFNEQERWFMNMIDESISNVEFKVLSTQMIDAKTGEVTISQHHKMDKEYYLTYPLLFKYEEGMWMDYGFSFEEYETDRFIVKYQEGEERLDEFIQMLNESFDNLDTVYEVKPFDDYEMKLFIDQDMLRQRSIPANPWLFTGWSEPDESMKIYTGHPAEYDTYAGVIQHELVHHITINICNNNLPVWLLEGIAMYDGTAPYGFDSSRMLSSLTKANVSQTIEDLETKDLGTDLTRLQIFNYYNTSYMYIRFIVETYGRETMMDIFYEAGKKPFHDSTLNDNFELNNKNTAQVVIQNVLGLSKAELSKEYLAWLETVDFDNLG